MLSDNLMTLRNLKSLSQEEAAEAAGVSRQAYAKWEKGETVPDVEKCAALAEFYGVTIDSLWHFEQEEKKLEAGPPPKGKYIFGTVTVSERGQIVIPKEAREIFGITGGTRLIVLGDKDEEGIALTKAEIFEEKMRRMVELASHPAKT